MKADNTVKLIGKIKTSMNQFIVSELEKEDIYGIVPSHGSIILSLLENDTLTMSELASKIDKDPSTVTTLVKKLCKLGYTDLSRDKSDKRVNKVSLTFKGKELETILVSISEKIYRKQYEGIDKKQVYIFREVLKKIIDNFR